MHYHVWTRTTLHTMNRDPRRYQTRSAAYKHIRRHLDGKEAMVLQCDRMLGLSPQQREEVYKQALRVAQEVAFRGLWRAARSALETAATRLTELVVKQSADEEVRDDYVTAVFRDDSETTSGSSSGTSERPWSTRPAFPSAEIPKDRIRASGEAEITFRSPFADRISPVLKTGACGSGEHCPSDGTRVIPL